MASSSHVVGRSSAFGVTAIVTDMMALAFAVCAFVIPYFVQNMFRSYFCLVLIALCLSILFLLVIALTCCYKDAVLLGQYLISFGMTACVFNIFIFLLGTIECLFINATSNKAEKEKPAAFYFLMLGEIFFHFCTLILICKYRENVKLEIFHDSRDCNANRSQLWRPPTVSDQNENQNVNLKASCVSGMNAKFTRLLRGDPELEVPILEVIVSESNGSNSNGQAESNQVAISVSNANSNINFPSNQNVYAAISTPRHSVGSKNGNSSRGTDSRPPQKSSVQFSDFPNSTNSSENGSHSILPALPVIPLPRNQEYRVHDSRSTSASSQAITVDSSMMDSSTPGFGNNYKLFHLNKNQFIESRETIAQRTAGAQTLDVFDVDESSVANSHSIHISPNIQTNSEFYKPRHSINALNDISTFEDQTSAESDDEEFDIDDMIDAPQEYESRVTEVSFFTEGPEYHFDGTLSKDKENSQHGTNFNSDSSALSGTEYAIDNTTLSVNTSLVAGTSDVKYNPDVHSMLDAANNTFSVLHRSKNDQSLNSSNQMHF